MNYDKEIFKNILKETYSEYQELLKKTNERNNLRCGLFRRSKYIASLNSKLVEIQTIRKRINIKLLPIKLYIDSFRYKIIKEHISMLSKNTYTVDIERCYNSSFYCLDPLSIIHTDEVETSVEFEKYYNDILLLFDKEKFTRYVRNQEKFPMIVLKKRTYGSSFQTLRYQKKFKEIIKDFPVLNKNTFGDYDLESWEKVDTSIYARSNRSYPKNDDGGFDPGIG